MSEIGVVFTSVPARKRSQTTGGYGREVNYEIVIALQFRGQPRPFGFPHPDYHDYRIPGGRPIKRMYSVDTEIAERMLSFVRSCFVRGNPRYDGFSFVHYLWDRIDSPHEIVDIQSIRGVRALSTQVGLGGVYVILNQDRLPIHAFIGLAPNLCLSVTSIGSTLSIHKVDDLIYCFGGVEMSLVTDLQLAGRRGR